MRGTKLYKLSVGKRKENSSLYLLLILCLAFNGDKLQAIVRHMIVTDRCKSNQDLFRLLAWQLL